MPPKITLYENQNFSGRSEVFTKSCPNLLDAGFDQTAASLTVDSGVWVLFETYEYGGKIWVVQQGDKIPYLTYFNKMTRSIKLLEGNEYNDLYDEAVIKIYPVTNLQGRELTLNKDVPNLEYFGFLNEDFVSSVDVPSGVWVGYDGRYFKGRQTLFLRGNYSQPGQGDAFNGGFLEHGIASLRKINHIPEGELRLLKIEYDTASANVRRDPKEVFKWTTTNNTGVEQTISITEEHTITKENTCEFIWNVGSKITSSIDTKAGIPELGFEEEIGISAELSVTFGVDTVTKTTDIRHWKAVFPTKIPAKTKVTLTSSLVQGKFDIPFTAFFVRGNDKKCIEKHYGKVYGVQFFNFNTEFKSINMEE